MASFFTDGFESGDISAWSSVNGNPAAQSSVKHKGSYALFSQITSEAKTNYVGRTHSVMTGVYLRFYVYFGVLPSTYSEVIIARCGFTSSRPLVTVYCDGVTHWRLRDGAGVIRHSDSGPQPQTWYCMELKAVVGEESALYVNGVKILTGNAPSGSSSSFYLMAYAYSGIADGVIVYFDDAEAGDSYIGFLNSTVPVTDSAALSEEQFASKAFTITEGLTLQEQASISNRLKPVLDTLKSVDGSPLVNKMLKIADDVYIIEVIEVGKGDRRTRLFLVMGNVAIQLTS